MAALEPGAPFPPVVLRDPSGAPRESLTGETLYAVFKTTCPTCELTWPFLERLRGIAGGGLSILAVSQDDAEKTHAFNARLGTHLDTAYDPNPWPASETLGLTTVPTLFRVGADGRIAETIVGFDRERLRGLAERAATLAGKAPVALFRADESVPAIKPG